MLYFLPKFVHIYCTRICALLFFCPAGCPTTPKHIRSTTLARPYFHQMLLHFSSKIPGVIVATGFCFYFIGPQHLAYSITCSHLKYFSFCLIINPSEEQSGCISSIIDSFILLSIPGTVSAVSSNTKVQMCRFFCVQPY